MTPCTCNDWCAVRLSFFREQSTVWQVRWGRLNFSEQALAELHKRFDGLICFAVQPMEKAALEALDIPVVNVSSSNLPIHVTSIIPDDDAIGRLAANHFQQALYHSFAFVGAESHPFARSRAAAFKACLQSDPYVELWLNDKHPAHSYELSNQRIIQFLQSLPRNTGVFAANDIFARRICELAIESDISVPNTIAILGVDAEEMISLSSPVSLSSIDIDSYGIGYQAAKHLHRQIQQPESPVTVSRIPPKGVLSAASTDHLATEDEMVARVVQLIRIHACNGINVPQLATHVGISRRVLERRFRKATGKSLNEQINKVRMDRAIALLEKSQLSISQIAEQCGFASVYYFSRAFKQSTGRSPKFFRAGN
ncbi:MAG: helix-turn-helix domain-containing protein [Verrucomicrobia bacterium]|nr:helix-turn-helix domain-containing protein [Verrucomicrobiota bacterium]